MLSSRIVQTALLTTKGKGRTTSTARLEFLKFLGASPYVAALGGVTSFLRQSGFAQASQSASEVIANPAEALNVFNVFDFEEAAGRSRKLRQNAA